jgi:hypothetical protein
LCAHARAASLWLVHITAHPAIPHAVVFTTGAKQTTNWTNK